MSVLIAPPILPVNADRLDVLGSVITILRSDASRFSFDLEAPPGVGVPMHEHAHEVEMLLIRRGRVRFSMNGRETIAMAGDTIFAPRNVPHAWEAVGDEIVDAIVTVVPGNLEQMFRDLAALPKGSPDLVGIAQICGRHAVRFV